jgi:hypothetical protein
MWFFAQDLSGGANELSEIPHCHRIQSGIIPKRIHYSGKNFPDQIADFSKCSGYITEKRLDLIEASPESRGPHDVSIPRP